MYSFTDSWCDTCDSETCTKVTIVAVFLAIGKHLPLMYP